MLKPRKLLAAAAFASLAACGGPVQGTPQELPMSETRPVAEVVPTPVVEAVVVPEAAAPRCDENGRPLAGNVRTKGRMDDCS